MGSNFGTSEIIESNEGPNLSHEMPVDDRAGKHSLPSSEPYSLEDDLSQLIKTFQLRTPPRGAGPFGASKQSGVNSLQKNAIKKSGRSGTSQSSGIGISETVTLKQALRGLCISQASEMAAMKRLSRPAGLSSSDAGASKKFYKAVVVKAGQTGGSLEDKGSLFEISLVPEKDSPSLCENTKSLKENQINEEKESSSKMFTMVKKATLNSSDARFSKVPEVKLSKKNVISSLDCSVPTALKDIKTETPTSDVIATAKSDDEGKTLMGTSTKGKLMSKSPTSNSRSGFEVSNSDAGPWVIKPIRNIEKGNEHSTSVSDITNSSSYFDRSSAGSGTCGVDSQKDSNHKNVGPETSSTNDPIKLSSINKNSIISLPYSCSGNQHEDCTGWGKNEIVRIKEKELLYQSSKSSIGDYSSGTSISDDSNLSSNAGCGNRPHMSKEWRWEAIRHVEMQHGSIGFGHFKLLKRLGGGDIGTVYLAELVDTGCLFALKIMDIDFLAKRRKTLRAQTEREILQMLDHPFLPTLYAHFMTDKLSCFVMEYCPGGDLHVLRQTQPGRCFSEQAARFYVAEILLALEYLHMLGVVYRDLKPENVLVREDGHIMLSDFDLSMRCAVSPTLLKSSSQSGVPGKKLMQPCAESPCIDPLCLQPAWVQVPCFTPRLVSAATRTGKPKSKATSQARPLPQLVAEPTDARSNSFVGTHEYLAPEIIKGEGHGSAVDWWTFGIFLYELLFGRTPFKGLGNEDTLANAVLQSLEFPETPAVSFHARDLIGRLLIKEPENRLGFMRGSAEIKQHPFFEGLNWALIRCAVPPEIPTSDDYGALGRPSKRKDDKCVEVKITEEHLEFELF